MGEERAMGVRDIAVMARGIEKVGLSVDNGEGSRVIFCDAVEPVEEPLEEAQVKAGEL